METEKLNNTDEECGLKNGYEIRAYKRRWVIISIFIAYAAMNSGQWTEYSIITNLVIKYYDVTPAVVEWTCIIYMGLYPFLIVPACYIVDKKGLRVTALIGGLGTALGAFIKLFSIGRDLFWIVLIGQALESISQVFILCLPTKIAGVWFRASEISTACALCVIGSQLGCALGFFYPSLIVKDHDDPEEIGADIKTMGWVVMGIMAPIALALILYFPKRPPKPPNAAQVKERHENKQVTFASYLNSLKTLFKNKGFLIHSIGFGINLGVLSTLGALLNQIVLDYFENSQEDAGRMGFVMILAGIFGSFVFGVILDKTHKYKECTLFLFGLNAVSLIAFMYSLEFRSKLAAYLTIAIEGLACNGYYSVAYELAAELTHPSPESTTSGMLIVSSQITGVTFAALGGYQLRSVGAFWTLAVQSGLLVLGTIITIFVPNVMRRQAAMNLHNSFQPSEKVLCIQHK